MADMRKQMEQLLREKQFNQEYIESLTMEKEEMIRSHTIETGELRKKVSVLTDHVQRLESAAMTAPANNYVSGYDDMNDMTMPGSWDNVNFLGEYPMEQEVKQELQVVPAKKTDVSFPVDSEKSSSQGGILFMLFLVGAFVLSSRSTPAIPRVSEDVRAEAATLLENVFKDAGVNGASNTLNALAPQPSGGSWVDNSAMPMGDTSMGGVAPSMLGQLGDSLTQPTDEQANEQLFGLSAAQYNGVSSQDFINNAPERTTSQGRKNLADALSAMRTNKQSAADVYTRSLLWDQIPSEVVRNFAKMVSESNSAKAGANE